MNNLQRQLERETIEVIDLEDQIKAMEEKLKRLNSRLIDKKKKIEKIINKIEELSKSKQIQEMSTEGTPNVGNIPTKQIVSKPLKTPLPKISKIPPLKKIPNKISIYKEHNPKQVEVFKGKEKMTSIIIEQENLNQKPKKIMEVPKKNRFKEFFKRFPRNKDKSFIEPFTIEKLVEIQIDEYDKPIPYILHYLIKKLFEKGGKSAEVNHLFRQIFSKRN